MALKENTANSTAVTQIRITKVSMDITYIHLAVFLVVFCSSCWTPFPPWRLIYSTKERAFMEYISTWLLTVKSCFFTEATKKPWKTTRAFLYTSTGGWSSFKLKASCLCLEYLAIVSFVFTCKDTILKSTLRRMAVRICIPSKGNGVEYLHLRQCFFKVFLLIITIQWNSYNIWKV